MVDPFALSLSQSPLTSPLSPSPPLSSIVAAFFLLSFSVVVCSLHFQLLIFPFPPFAWLWMISLITMSVVKPCCPCDEVPCSIYEYGLSCLVLAAPDGIFVEWLWFTSPWMNWMRSPPVLHWTRFALASLLPWIVALCRCNILRYLCGDCLNLFSGLVPI